MLGKKTLEVKLSERSSLERKAYVGFQEQLLERKQGVEVLQERRSQAEEVSAGCTHGEQGASAGL